MLMFVYGTDADAAFDVLREQSQLHNIKLRLIAEQISKDLLELSTKSSLSRQLALDGLLLTAHQRIAYNGASTNGQLPADCGTAVAQVIRMPMCEISGVHDKGMEEPPPPPPGQPQSGPAGGHPDSKSSGLRRFRLRNPLSIVLVAVIVIGMVAAGLLAGELYARHRAESVVAAATECMVQDTASVSFGATPLLLQLATSHYRNISIHTAGNRIGNARGMKADVRIDDVQLNGNADAMGTVGALDAVITWSADGMKQSIQEAIPLLRSLVTGVQTNPDDGTIKLQGNLGSVTTKPQVTDGLVALQVVDVTGLGLLLPREMVQSALDAFTNRIAEHYPLGIHADSVQITDDGVTARYSTRDMSIPRGDQGNQGNQGITDNQDPCFANL